MPGSRKSKIGLECWTPSPIGRGVEGKPFHPRNHVAPLPKIKSKLLLILVISLTAPWAKAQGYDQQVSAILSRPLQSPQVVTFQLQEYLMRRVPPLPAPASAAQWTAGAERIRRHLLAEVVFHGWPKAWVNSPPKFEDLGTIPSGKRYQVRKLRYEIVPGFWSTALLYEPEKVQGRIPGVLVVMGHFPRGKAMQFNQKLCINYALQGLMALNLEWPGMGEFSQKGNEHWFASELDLAGANGLGLFYLAMRRGLDYLAANPHVDPDRLGMTGLSGGGWQTILLSALDPRVLVSVPVAGYTSLPGRLERVDVDEPGDIEQNATDFLVGQDYPTLTAMRAPRPTLMINNAEDDCCFRAPFIKRETFDRVKPFFMLYGKEDVFQFHENTNPSTHNYRLDNRQQSYRFFTQYFHLPLAEHEIPVDADVKSYDDLAVGVPENNLTILGLARRFAAEIERKPTPTDPAARDQWASAERATLRKVVRYTPVQVRHPWLVGDTKDKGLASISYRFQMSNGLSAVGVWLQRIAASEPATLTIVLDDKGKKGAAKEVWDRAPEISDRLERGDQVLVVDPLFFGEGSPQEPSYLFTEMLAATGARPLGLEAAQLLGIAHWAEQQWHPQHVRLETAGIRSQGVGLVAAALEPRLFSEVVTHAGMPSLDYLLDKPVAYQEAPDLFCLDLYKDFDVDGLAALAAPIRVQEEQTLTLPPKP